MAAAAPVTVTDMLVNLGFNAQAAAAIVNDQGYDTLDELELLTDEEVISLCKNVRKPTGNTRAGRAITLKAENNLKLACYMLRHYKRTSRTPDPADVTVDAIRELADLKKQEKKHEDKEPPTIKPSDWVATFELLTEWLRQCRGTSGLPLAYVVRNDDAVAPDPAGVGLVR